MLLFHSFYANKFNLAPWLIGLSHDLQQYRRPPHSTAGGSLVRPPAHAHRTPHAIHPDRGSGWCNCLRAHSDRCHSTLVCGLHHHSVAEHGFLADPGGSPDAGYYPLQVPLTGQWDHLHDGWYERSLHRLSAALYTKSDVAFPFSMGSDYW